MSRFREPRSARKTVEGDGVRFRENRRNDIRKNTIINEEWEKDNYILSDLVRNTEVCIHCMGNKCKRKDEPDHKNIFFPKKFTELINYPKDLPEFKEILNKEGLIQDEKFKDFNLFFNVCMYNLCNGKCKCYSEGRYGKITIDENIEVIYCYPDLNYVNKNRIFIGLHLDISLTRNDREIVIRSIPLHLQYKSNHENHYEYDDEHSMISNMSNQSKQINNNIPLNPNMKKDWVNILNKNLPQSIESKNIEDEILIQKELINQAELQIDMESIIKEVESENTPKTHDLYENQNQSNELKENKDENQQQNQTKYDRYNYEDFVDSSYRFMNCIYDENLILKDRIKELEKKMDKLIQMNEKYIESQENKKEEMMRRYKEALKECNNSVSEQINRTELDKYFYFFN